MSTARKYALYTFDDFRSLVAEGQKADLIGGVIYMASPDNTEHNDINGWLFRLLADFLDELLINGRLYFSRVAFRLGEGDGPEPDIGYLCPERAHLAMKTFVHGPPDLAIEIISPDSMERDYNKKKRQFEAAGVREYWIIDPFVRKVTSFALGKSGRFQKVRVTGDKVTSKVIDGFYVRPSWLWQGPLPKKQDALTEILQSLKKGGMTDD